ncbi:MAG: TetR family transcriptional regulator [Microbacterium sp.]|nr:MAG: TetR family transcriptional regulator [Microbacterium sp.]
MVEYLAKRERTRQHILETAFELFEAQGYDRTTTAQIATTAGVSEMTLFRHFASKDRLLLDDPYDPVIAQAVAAQPPELPALTRATAGVRAAWRTVPEPAEEAVRRRMRIAARTPGLTGAIRANTRATETAIARALTDTGADPTVAQIAAAATLAALMESLTAWAVADAPCPLDDAIRLALDVLDDTVPR